MQPHLCAHCHADIRSGQRRRIVDAVADHHDGTVFPLGEHNENFLVRRQSRAYRVDSQACSNGVRDLAPIPRCENNPLYSQHSQPLQERLCARPQFISQPYLARQMAIDGNGNNDRAGNFSCLEAIFGPLRQFGHHELDPTDRDGSPLNDAPDAFTRSFDDVRRYRKFKQATLRFGNDGLGDDMLGRLIKRGSKA